ncbi:ABC transporter permease [Streptomyces fagopyri]|uniref:ABC transporter permease n=1 Tax=Streptomyces fagopyri TaxID=2662397 RepID=UPI00382AE36A
MASTDTGIETEKDGSAVAEQTEHAHGLAGLDALDSVQAGRTPLHRVSDKQGPAPVTAVALVLVVWQVLVWANAAPDYKLPAPSDVWGEVRDAWVQGTLLDYIWTSVSRGLLGFLLALAIGRPLGPLVARVGFVQAAIGHILSGLQSLPSVAWVPPAAIWLGLNNSMMYDVILLGAVSSIANGLIAGIDQISPLFLRAGRTVGATPASASVRMSRPSARASTTLTSSVLASSKPKVKCGSSRIRKSKLSLSSAARVDSRVASDVQLSPTTQTTTCTRSLPRHVERLAHHSSVAGPS